MSPVYEFKCPSCSERIAQTRKMSDQVMPPICGDCLVTMERVFSATPIHFKGSGFYATDKGKR